MCSFLGERQMLFASWLSRQSKLENISTHKHRYMHIHMHKQGMQCTYIHIMCTNTCMNTNVTIFKRKQTWVYTNTTSSNPSLQHSFVFPFPYLYIPFALVITLVPQNQQISNLFRVLSPQKNKLAGLLHPRKWNIRIFPNSSH